MHGGQPITHLKFINYSMWTDRPRGALPGTHDGANMDLTTRIGQTTGVESEKVCEVVTLALVEFHRLTIVDEKGATAAVIEACFLFGADAAFHLMGFLSSGHDYHGRIDEARMWTRWRCASSPKHIG
jgi:hypothetical protein